MSKLRDRIKNKHCISYNIARDRFEVIDVGGADRY